MQTAPDVAVTLDELLRLLDLTETDGFVVGAAQQHPEDRVFGGLLLAQAVVAAGRSVPSNHRPFTLQADFVAGVPTDEPLRWRVEHVSDAASLTTRRTTLVAPDGSERFTALSRWGTIRDDLVDHRPATPRQVPDPEHLPDLTERFGGDERVPMWWRAERPVTFRHTEPPPYVTAAPAQDHQSAWLRTTGPLPDDPVIHAAVMAYVSDMSILEGAFRALGSLRHAPGSRILSLTHTLTWHAHPDLGEWHQFDSDVRAVAHGRTLGEGRIHDRFGEHVLTASQVGLVRLA